MRRLKVFAYILLLIGVILGLIFIVFAYFKPKAAGVYIESNPISRVYINGEERGSTPYKENLPPEELVVRLEPTENEDVLELFETKITLVPGVETAIRHDFSDNEERSASEIISFEKTDRDSTSLSVVTAPEDVKLLIDGKIRAFSPYKTTTLTSGEHNILISESGYKDRVIKVKTHRGYNLTLFVDLAKIEDTTEDLRPTPTQSVELQVRVLPTGSGFLRVRSKPGLDGLELARVEPGDEYTLVTREQNNGWYNIEYSPGETGWVLGEYVELLEDNSEDQETSSDSDGGL